MIPDKSTVLFIGDSITDCGRNREDDQSLGNGFANMVAAFFSARFPERNVSFLNRGISGDRVDTLAGRWEEDCLILKPDLVTLLVGVNNTIHRFKRDNTTSPQEFEANYREIVEKTIKALKCSFIILEPFLLPVDRVDRRPAFVTSTEVWKSMREDLNVKIDIIRKISRGYGITFIPLDGIFSALSVYKSSEEWLFDGIHPTPAGHAVISDQWFEAVRKLNR